MNITPSVTIAYRLRWLLLLPQPFWSDSACYFSLCQNDFPSHCNLYIDSNDTSNYHSLRQNDSPLISLAQNEFSNHYSLGQND